MAPLRVRFTLTASRKLDEILGFIAQENPHAAGKLSEQIEQGLDRLSAFPDSGRKIPEVPERRERELVVPPCVRIFYRVEGKNLLVLYAMRSEQAFQGETLE
jgi:toxin ParE1/3/4